MDKTKTYARKPDPTPEGRLIKLVREAAYMRTEDAAKAAGISKARWSQVEAGYERRTGRYKPVSPSSVLLAKMAFALDISPERLETEGERPDAAVVMRERTRFGPPAEPETPESVRRYWGDMEHAPRIIREIWAEKEYTVETKQNLTIVVGENRSNGSVSSTGSGGFGAA